MNTKDDSALFQGALRLRVVSNFGDGDSAAGEIHARERNFQ